MSSLIRFKIRNTTSHFLSSPGFEPYSPGTSQPNRRCKRFIFLVRSPLAIRSHPLFQCWPHQTVREQSCKGRKLEPTQTRDRPIQLTTMDEKFDRKLNFDTKGKVTVLINIREAP